MIPKEILKKVKRIEIQTRGIVNDLFTGQYHSVFKGRGMEFSEVREYQYGDDIRTIDWNVSARAGHPYIKVFEEERELTVMLLVDVSSSADFGTFQQMKGELAIELCAVLAFSATKNNDKVGLIIFTDRIEKYIPPKKGKSHVLRVLRELLYFKPEGVKTDINAVLEYLNRVTRKRATVFLVSDFLSEDYKKALQMANKKHDIVAITITDPREQSFPNVGFIELEDAESGETVIIDTTDASLMNLYSSQAEKQRVNREKLFKSMNIDFIDVYTNKSYIDPLVKFFRKRAKRFH
ncbi:DUF58 domain-containing protein [candidate division KSB1 bacterium]|nr:DUF58 domain-containing protein [candidate division KSB1 bacterium]